MREDSFVCAYVLACGYVRVPLIGVLGCIVLRNSILGSRVIEYSWHIMYIEVVAARGEVEGGQRAKGTPDGFRVFANASFRFILPFFVLRLFFLRSSYFFSPLSTILIHSSPPLSPLFSSSSSRRCPRRSFPLSPFSSILSLFSLIIFLHLLFPFFLFFLPLPCPLYASRSPRFPGWRWRRE